MEALLYIGLFIVSLAALLRASDWFIDAAEQIGLSLGISPFIIGVTIVAFGTSLPELASSIVAVLSNESEIVIGNVVGSNITNIALVLAMVAIVGKKIIFEKDLINIDMPLLMTSAFLFWFVIRDQHVSIAEALLLLAGLVIFLAYSFKDDGPDEDVEHSKASWKTYGMLLVGGALVSVSANYTIVAISKLSEIAGISTEIIALTLVALGTSLPELIVSIAASRKGKTEIAVGNILGSNIFNTYAVMSIPSFFGELVITDNILNFSFPFMMALTILFAVMCLSQKISRWEGWMLFVFYLFFILDSLKGVL